MIIVSRVIAVAVGIMTIGAAHWEVGDLDQELLPIAFLESSYGLNIDHKPHSRGDFYSSYGALGLKPATAYDEYLRSPALRNKWPGLDDRLVFTEHLKNESQLYRDTCNAHWHRIRTKTPSLAHSVFAWRWGYTASNNASNETVNTNLYVMAYLRIYNGESK